MHQLLSSISDALLLLRQGSLSAVELCEAALVRQETVSRLNAFITTAAKQARASASDSHRRLCKEGQRPLDGIPVALKDNFCTADIPTTCGSRILKEYIPPYSATVATRLERAGAIIMGKTNMDEFGMGSGTVDSTFGPSRNIYRSGIPYAFQNINRPNNVDKEEECLTTDVPTTGLKDDFYIAGGSSGGSAIAVASGAAFAALGSDTGGSIRNPSYCGVVGLKPSYGVVPRHGLISLVNSMDVPGLIGRYVDDVATVLGVIAGLDPQDSTSVESELPSLQLPENPNVKGLVVGIPREYHCPGMDPEVVHNWTKVADMFEDSGAEVREVSMPHTKYSIVCYSVLNPCEVASNFTRYTGVEYGSRVESCDSMEAMYALTRSAGLNEVVRGRILAGNYFLLRENKEKYFNQGLKVRRLIYQDFERVWDSGVHILLTPVTLSAAQKYSEFSRLDNRSQSAIQDICTQAANMAGVPAVSIPVSINSEGLPLSLQLVARWGQDALMLSVAKWIEQKVQFPRLIIADQCN